MASLALLALLLALPAGAQVVEYSAPVPAAPGELAGSQTAAIENQNDKLKDAINSPAVTQDELAGRAAALFGAVQRPEASAVGGLELRGWDKPDQSTTGDIDGMVGRSAETIAQADYKAQLPSLKTDPPPAPDPTLITAWRYGEDIEQNGMAGYDDGKKLGRGTLGAYLYSKVKALGILFNKDFREVQRWGGDEFAAATFIHESTHAKDHADGQLNPVEVKKGEKSAFQTEYKYLRLVDPSGQKLAWARVNACGAGSMAPKIVCQYFTHLATISYYGERGDWDGLVTALGYQDRSGNPFAHDDD